MRRILVSVLGVVIVFALPGIGAGEAGATSGCCAPSAPGCAAETPVSGCDHKDQSVTAGLTPGDVSPEIDLGRAIDNSAAISEALAKDQMDGVADYAAAMAVNLGIELAQSTDKSSTQHGDQHSGMAGLVMPLEVLAKEGIDISVARDAFLGLQESFIPLANHAYSPAEGDAGWGVYHCGMAKGSWIQSKGPVANPYYGAKMLRCGSKVAALGTPHTGDQGNHGSHAH